MAVATLTPATSAQPVAASTFNSTTHREAAIGVAYRYGNMPRYVTEGQSDTIIGPGGVVMSRRAALACDLH